jgi:hypothetical protein
MRFVEAMASRSDEELIEVVTGPVEDWEPEAVEAAQAELAKRGRTAQQTAYRSAPGFNSTAIPKSEGPPLDGAMKFAATVLGLGLSVVGVLLALGVMSNWTKKGERRRGAEFVTWTVGGAVVSFLLMMMAR